MSSATLRSVPSALLARSLFTLVVAAVLGTPASAATVAHWRFETRDLLADSGPNAVRLSHLGKLGGPEWYPLPGDGGPGAAFPRLVAGGRNDTGIAGASKTMSFNHRQLAADLSAHDERLPSGLTFEAFVNLTRSHPSDSAVLAGRGVLSPTGASWALSVTGENSPRGTRTVLFQIVNKGGWSFDELLTLESGLSLDLGKDYYLAVAADFSGGSSASVTFYLKDLSDPKAKLRTNVVRNVQPVGATAEPLVLGANPAGGSPWYGVIDEVRLSDTKLSERDLLINSVAKP